VKYREPGNKESGCWQEDSVGSLLWWHWKQGRLWEDPLWLSKFSKEFRSRASKQEGEISKDQNRLALEGEMSKGPKSFEGKSKQPLYQPFVPFELPVDHDDVSANKLEKELRRGEDRTFIANLNDNVFWRATELKALSLNETWAYKTYALRMQYIMRTFEKLWNTDEYTVWADYL